MKEIKQPEAVKGFLPGDRYIRLRVHSLRRTPFSEVLDRGQEILHSPSTLTEKVNRFLHRLH